MPRSHPGCLGMRASSVWGYVLHLCFYVKGLQQFRASVWIPTAR